MTQNTQVRRGAAGVVLIAATVVSGLMAGVWYAYATSVMGALGRTDDRTFIEVMQNINEMIQNPVFFAGLFGALILPAVAAWQARRAGQRDVLLWTLAGLALYFAVFVVTSGASVPLNDQLAAAGNPAKIADPAGVRGDFEDPWVAWNIVRALLNTAAVACLARALAVRGRVRQGRYAVQG
ncbi:anthrone oxygenase family protein [Streptomyces sp. NBC_01304]|uniref:anthrone oxygenase family protein n=1 Tax=Streptomyces sp. NBC_01304 TaxID=2903818 RepID=UPI002E0F025B|nr:DUF1772 domain-containing protein [Streptomyces sp. NBC_01304]